MMKAMSPPPSVTVIRDVIEKLKSKFRYSVLLSSDMLYDILKHSNMQLSVVIRLEWRIFWCLKNKIVVGTIYTV